MMPEFESVEELVRALMRGRHALVVMREMAQKRRGVWLASGNPAKRQDAMGAAFSIGHIDEATMALDVVHGDARLRSILKQHFDAEAGEDKRQHFADVNQDTPPAA